MATRAQVQKRLWVTLVVVNIVLVAIGIWRTYPAKVPAIPSSIDLSSILPSATQSELYFIVVTDAGSVDGRLIVRVAQSFARSHGERLSVILFASGSEAALLDLQTMTGLRPLPTTPASRSVLRMGASDLYLLADNAGRVLFATDYMQPDDARQLLEKHIFGKINYPPPRSPGPSPPRWQPSSII
jgi:hypothetical protein